MLSKKGSLFLQCRVSTQRYMAQPQLHCALFLRADQVELGGARLVWTGAPLRVPAHYDIAADGRLIGPTLAAPLSVMPGDGLVVTETGLQWIAAPTRGPTVGWRIGGTVDWTIGETIEMTEVIG